MSGNGVDLGAIYQGIVALQTNITRVESGLASMRLELSDLRQEVRDYHGAVVGHGIMLTEHDERITKLEQTSRPPEAA